VRSCEHGNEPFSSTEDMGPSHITKVLLLHPSPTILTNLISYPLPLTLMDNQEPHD